MHIRPACAHRAYSTQDQNNRCSYVRIHVRTSTIHSLDLSSRLPRHKSQLNLVGSHAVGYGGHRKNGTFRDVVHTHFGGLAVVLRVLVLAAFGTGLSCHARTGRRAGAWADRCAGPRRARRPSLPARRRRCEKSRSAARCPARPARQPLSSSTGPFLGTAHPFQSPRRPFQRPKVPIVVLRERVPSSPPAPARCDGSQAQAKGDQGRRLGDNRDREAAIVAERAHSIRYEN